MKLWKERDYRWWLVSDTSGVAGASLRGFALPLIAFLLSGSTVVAGWLGTATAAIAVSLSLLGGVLVDRHDRRRLVLIYAGSSAVLWGIVALLGAFKVLTWQGLMVAALIAAVVTALFRSATDAALRSLVTVEQYPSAMALNQGRDASVQLAAGPVGGLLMGRASWAPLAVSSVVHLVQGVAIIAVKRDLAPPAREARPIVHDLLEGMRWMLARTVMVHFGLAATLINLGFTGVMFTFNLSLLATGHTPVQVGLLDAVAAACALVGATFAATLVQRVRTGTLIPLVFVWELLCLVPAVIWHTYLTYLIVCGASALLIPAINAGAFGYMMGRTPPELQGRVAAVFGVFSQALAALAPATAGWLLHARGPGITIGVFVVVVAASTLVSGVSKPIRGVPRPAQWEADEEESSE